MLQKVNTMNDTLCRTRWLGALVALGLLSACANDRPLRTPDVSAAVRAELPAAPSKPSSVVPARVTDALAEPAPAPLALPPEPRLDLLVNNAQARDVFLAIVADTRYSMLMHPDVTGTLSVTLRGVTVTEALEAIRDVYGYDFKIDGRRIVIYAPTLQTRIFTLNYPTSQRAGTSELRVSSGASLQGSGTNSGGTSSASSSSSGAQPESSRVSTSSRSDFWSEVSAAVKSLVGNGEGRSVVSSPQAGILAVRAMPEELRQVEKFLKATQIAVERQVMLEAKVIEIELSDGYQSGVNWGAFGSDVNGQAALGVIGSNISNGNAFLQGTTVAKGTVPFPAAASGSGLFGLALATSQFGAVLGFLETQGDVQTLSSPRVATLNNQKAVLKVGSDEFFVTGVTGGTVSNSSSSTSGANASTTMPTVTLTPFFSGISLDVTPQIDDGINITLHVHPSLTTVTEKTKQVDLGSVGNYRLPLASSSVNETDTLVRIQDGTIVAIGGLMQLESSRNASGLPGTTSMPGLGALFGNRATAGRKKEVIVLIKPTIIRSAADWEAQARRTRAALDEMDAARARVIQIDGNVAK
ncbi:pilus (MSHA type) biogenesis protein MshL [Rhodoferax aquaticus]|uniref:Pilus (MSHA type) biogenesis protein MshL n=1 Tax=Rhodoferax aquaticus TaxID=2527691 RepID=A0A515EUW3_9BURK|nr:pilus (MSHA type) biogenesis protein MshL [Rhodoferax aquaticus]QDL56456.1 pilus (MSHA type) biogenesis protein MshL [Rhodoferax aquaticus]